MSNKINKNKISLLNKVYNENFISNLSLALFIRKCYNEMVKRNIQIKHRVSFEKISKRLDDDEYFIDKIFGYQYPSFEDCESVQDMNKCIDTLIIFKSISLI